MFKHLLAGVCFVSVIGCAEPAHQGRGVTARFSDLDCLAEIHDCCVRVDYWRERDSTPLARAFGYTNAFCGVALEQKFSTGVGGIGPNLDVALKTADGTLFAIESKFGEPVPS